MADYSGEIALDQYASNIVLCPKCNAALPHHGEIRVPHVSVCMCQNCLLSILTFALHSKVFFEGFLNIDDMMFRANELKEMINKTITKKPWWKFW